MQRSRVANPSDAAEPQRFVVLVAEQASTITGRTIARFQVMFGGAIGTISWSTPVKDFADVEVQLAKLQATPDYVAPRGFRVEALGDDG